MPPRPISHFRAHDYSHLIRRWRRAAREKGLVIRPFCEAGGYPLWYATPRRPRPDLPWIYISAGIHGDEPAGTEGFIDWVESSPGLIGKFNPLFFPCLNPWGLVNNTRLDSAGRDLNRSYHDDSVPQTAAHKRLLADRRFALALTLHEDYDANGIYIYEARQVKPHWAEALLAAAARHVPIDNRKSIDGRASTGGIVRRRFTPGLMPLHPEAFALHFHFAERTLTIETPSECHIDSRAAAHGAVIDLAVRKCLAQRAAHKGAGANSKFT
jgi:hypothetical protein